MTTPTQITWRRDSTGNLTPMYRQEMGPWLRCDQQNSTAVMAMKLAQEWRCGCSYKDKVAKLFKARIFNVRIP